MAQIQKCYILRVRLCYRSRILQNLHKGINNESRRFVGHQTAAGMKYPWRSMWTLAGMEARAISSKVLALRTSMNGEMVGSGEMTDDKITPARRRIPTVRTGRSDPFQPDGLMWWLAIEKAKPSPSSSSTAPGDATNTGSEGKQLSSRHSMCFLVTMSNLAIC